MLQIIFNQYFKCQNLTKKKDRFFQNYLQIYLIKIKKQNSLTKSNFFHMIVHLVLVGGYAYALTSNQT